MTRLGLPLLVVLACLGVAVPAHAVTPPSAPLSVSVTPGKSQANVSWVPGPVTADMAPITGFVATAILAGGVEGPTCAAPATQTQCTIIGLGGTVSVTVQATSEAGPSRQATSTQVFVTDQLAPPMPTSVQAKVGSSSGQAVVSWKPGRAQVDQSSATSYLVTASPTNGQGPSGLPSCGYIDAPATRCTLTGLAPNSTYRFTVVAVSRSGDSGTAVSKPLKIPGWRVTTPVQAILCSGSELEKPDTRAVRPSQVILDCDAYGPQYGAPLVRTVDGITWSSWATRRATGVGILHWPTAVPCTQGQPLNNCGVIVTDYPVTIQLRNPQPLNRSRSAFTFTEVGLFPSSTGPLDCQSSCWSVPPRRAYQ